MIEARIYSLLTKYITKTITPEERQELRTLVNVLDEEELAAVFSRLWDEQPAAEPPSRKILNDMWKEIRIRTAGRRNASVWQRTMQLAAAVLFLLLLVSSLYLYRERKERDAIAGRQMRIEANKGEKASVLLPDGTKMRLNAGSYVSYDQRYGFKCREVKMSGEVYFEVAEDAAKPFIVHTNRLQIEVLGTSFNVYSYENENTIETALISGHIKIVTHTSPSRTVYLHPNEKASFDKVSGCLKIEKSDNRFETAWLRGDLVFRSVPLKEVLSKLERWYGVTIRLDGSIFENDLFTGSFDCEDIRGVIEILQIHYDFGYKIKGNQVYIFSR